MPNGLDHLVEGSGKQAEVSAHRKNEYRWAADGVIRDARGYTCSKLCPLVCRERETIVSSGPRYEPDDTWFEFRFFIHKNIYIVSSI